jgi:hypothetical protein
MYWIGVVLTSTVLTTKIIAKQERLDHGEIVFLSFTWPASAPSLGIVEIHEWWKQDSKKM